MARAMITRWAEARRTRVVVLAVVLYAVAIAGALVVSLVD
jgi:hypothetical protein